MELTHGNSFKQVIPILKLDKEGKKVSLPTEGIDVNFSIYKEKKLQYTKDLEREKDGFELELSEDDINSFEAGEYTIKLKIKTPEETQTRTIPLTISNE